MEGTNFIEKRLELLQVIISTSLIALAVNILSGVITGQINISSKRVLCLTVTALLIIFVSILWLSKIYFERVILEQIPVVLLINRETGMVMPRDY